MLRYCKIHSALKSKINYAEIADSMRSMQNISTKSKNEKMSSGDFNPRDKATTRLDCFVPRSDAKRRQAQATRESILLFHRYHSPTPALPRHFDYQPKIRISHPTSREIPLSLQANYQVTSKALFRSCTISDNVITRLFFVCYSIVIRL